MRLRLTSYCNCTCAPLQTYLPCRSRIHKVGANMRRATVAAVLLGLLAVVSAGDVSKIKHSGGETCMLPISKLQCIRDWRSGFVAGMKFGYADFTGTGPASTVTTRLAPLEPWLQVCSTQLGNQTTYDMSVLDEGTLSIPGVQTAAPSWYGRASGVQDAFMWYPEGAPITQVIVLHAENPWGNKFGNIPAVLFGYIGDDGVLDFAVCGNPLYANFFLNPDTAKPPPTAPTLKATFTSGLSEGDDFTALGSFEGKCGVRGQGFSSYLGGDPNKSSKFRLKAITKPCFTKFDNSIKPFSSSSPDPLKRIWGNFECGPDDEICRTPCHFDKKHNKKSPSFSCVEAGLALAVGKHGPIEFDRATGATMERVPDASGSLQLVKTASRGLEGDLMPDEDEN